MEKQIAFHEFRIMAGFWALVLLNWVCTVYPVFCVNLCLAGGDMFLLSPNCSMNRLNTLPRGFGSLPALEVLDLTYNNLNEHSLPGNFFYLSEKPLIL